MEQSIKEILPIVISIIAAVVAIFAIFNTRSLFKKDIKVERLERIMSLFIKLIHHYSSLYSLYRRLDVCRTKPDLKKENFEKYELAKKDFLQIIDSKTLISTYYELEMLIKTYTSGELKLELLAFCKLYLDLLFAAFEGVGIVKDMIWTFDFPAPRKIELYVDSLERKLIKEIGISSKSSMYSRDIIRCYCINFLMDKIEKADQE